MAKKIRRSRGLDPSLLMGAAFLALAVPAGVAFYNYGVDKNGDALKEGTGLHQFKTESGRPGVRRGRRPPPRLAAAVVNDNGGLFGEASAGPRIGSLEAARGALSGRINDAGGVKSVNAVAETVAAGGPGSALDNGGPVSDAAADEASQEPVVGDAERLMAEARAAGKASGGITPFDTGASQQKSFGSMAKAGTGAEGAKRLVGEAQSMTLGRADESGGPAATTGDRSASSSSSRGPGAGPAATASPSGGSGGGSGGGGGGVTASLNLPDTKGVGLSSARMASSAGGASGPHGGSTLGGGSSSSGGGGGATGGSEVGGGGGGSLGGSFGGDSGDPSAPGAGGDTPSVLASLSAEARKKHYACTNYRKENECGKLNDCMGSVARGLGELSSCMKGGKDWYGCWRDSSMQSIMALAPDMVSQRRAFKNRCVQGVPDTVVTFYDPSPDPPVIRREPHGSREKKRFGDDLDRIFDRVESLLREK